VTLVVFNLGAAPGLVDDVATATGATELQVERRDFPDGEAYVRLLGSVFGSDVLLFAPPAGIAGSVLPILFAADAARMQGARRVGLVAPYLGYMRQDRAFKEGEAITSRTFARLLSTTFDWLLTVDPHLHRYSSLGEIYSIPTTTLCAAGPIARWTKSNVARPFIIGPDAESRQWVDRIADLLDAPRAVFAKDRRGDFDVELAGDHLELGQHKPVIVDDVISSGRTMIEAVELVLADTGVQPICVAVHALFSGEALRLLTDAGPEMICTVNTIEHPTNRISMAEELSLAIKEWRANRQ
jgi:ribose-phosphate pyrophosphokinase